NPKLIFIARKLEKRGLLTKDDEIYQIFSKCFKDYILSKIEKEKVEEVLKVEDHVLSNLNRRKILLKLEENPREIKELVGYMKISRPAIIKHLKFLKEKNLIREDIVLKPRIKKLYHITEQGKKLVSKSQTFEENSENFITLKVLQSKKKDEGKYLVRVPKGVHSLLGTKGGGKILLVGKNEKTVQCEVKTTYDFDSEERIVLVNEMIKEILDTEHGDEIKVKK
ncbi:MAG: ArsR/SmtB family transcription factor, partial [Candidatus Methanofastidiosia archaeon]